jgi:hypothetical protein
MTIKSSLIRIPWVRFIALARKKSGALGQLGWLESDMSNLRVSGKNRVPWMTYGAIDFIDQSVSPTQTVLELGGGASTAFWCDRGNPTVTVETDESWAAVLRDKLANFSNLEPIVTTPLTSIDDLAILGNRTFDVIANDFDSTLNRKEVIPWVVDHLNPQGWIIWDNSDRAGNEDAIGMLRNLGFGELAFFGLGPLNAYAFQTSIFSKNLPVRDWQIPKRNVINY